MSQTGETRKIPARFYDVVRVNEVIRLAEERGKDCRVSLEELGYAAWYARAMEAQSREDVEKLRKGPCVSEAGKMVQPDVWLPRMIEVEAGWAKKAAMLEGLVAAHTPPPPQTKD